MKKIYLLLNLLFILVSCQKEETPIIPIEQNDIQKLREQFSLSNFEDSYIKNKLEVNWENFHHLDDNSVEFSTNLTSKMEGAGLVFFTKYNVIASGESDGIWNYEIVKFVTTQANNLGQVSISEPLNFYGTLSYYNLQGSLTRIVNYKNGEIVEEIAENNPSKTNSTKINETKETICDNCVYLRIETWEDRYNIGSTSGGEILSVVYVGSVLTNVRYETIFSPIVYENNMETVHEHYAYGGGGTATGSAHNFELELTEEELEWLEKEEKVKTNELDNACVEGIIRTLQEKDSHLLVTPDLGDVSHLSQIIFDLFNTSDQYHLHFKIEDATSTNGVARNAFTTPISNHFGEFTFTITLDDDYVQNASQLAIARTIIHESLHAYLGYLYQDNPTTTFMQKLNRYRTEKSNLGEHEFMTQFTEAIGTSLSSWDNHSLDHVPGYYEALGWSGDMLKSSAFEKLDEEFQDLIKEANEAEGNALNEATINAKGNKCQ